MRKKDHHRNNHRPLDKSLSYILKLNDFFFFCLSELIEELVRATDLKFGMRVEYVLSRNKF